MAFNLADELGPAIGGSVPGAAQHKAARAPESYKDPGYDTAEQSAAQSTGVSADLLRRVRVKGEKSNASQVSPAGARTVYQVTQNTRDAVLKKYGVDAYSEDPAVQAHAAALVLKEGLDRHGGNHALALQEYHGGTNPKNWGPLTKNYAGLKGGKDSGGFNLADQLGPAVQPEAAAPPAHKTLMPPESSSARMPGFLNQIKEGFAQTAGLAAGAAEYVLPINKLKSGKTPGQTWDAAQKSVENLLGYKPKMQKPRDDTQKALEYAGNILGGSLIPEIGMTAKAARPALFAVEELGKIAMAGGWQMEGENIGARYGHPELGGWLSMAVGPAITGSLLHGMMGAAKKGAPAALKAAELLKKPLSKLADQLPADSKISQYVKRKLQGSPEDVAQMANMNLGTLLRTHIASEGNQARANELRQRYPGFKPTIATASDNPTLQAMKANLSRQTAENQAATAAEHASLTKVADDVQQTHFAPGKTPYLRGVADAHNKIIDKMGEHVNILGNQMRMQAEKFRSTGQKMFGDNFRELFAKHAASLTKVSNENYAATYKAFDAQGFKQSTQPIYESIKSFLGADAAHWQDKPGLLGRILNEYGPKAEEGSKILSAAGKPMTPGGVKFKNISFEELHSLYKKANQGFYDAKRSTDPEAIHAYGALKDVLKREIDGLAGTKYGAAGEMLGKANKFYAEQIIPKLQKGVGGRLRAETKYGETTSSEKVLLKLIANPTGFKETMAIMENDPAFPKILKEGILDHLNNKVVKNGVISPTGLRNFIATHKEWMDKVPGLRTMLEHPGNVTEQLLARRNALHAEIKAQDQTLLGKLLKSPDPDKLIAKALTQPNGLAPVIQALGNQPEALKSLMSTVATRLSETGDPAAALRNNAAQIKTLAEALGPGHWARLTDLMDMRSIAKRVEVPQTIDVPENIGAFQSATGSRLSQIWKGLFGTVRQSRDTLALNLAGNFMFKMSNADVKKAQEAILFDPDVTKLMVDIKHNGPTAKKVSDLRGHFAAYGVRVMLQGQGAYTKSKTNTNEAE